MTADSAAIEAARDCLDAHVRKIIKWHFSHDTGTPYWLDWAQQADFDPVSDIASFGDLTRRFPLFDDEVLRDLPHDALIPKPYRVKPFRIFETGGTTGMPKQRISWEDHLLDYTEFSSTLDDACFPKGGNWLMVGPTGPRRLRLGIEHLANIRGGACYFVDLDPRWVKKMIAEQQFDQTRAYKQHVIDQAVTILKHRDVACLFTTPLLLEALGERVSIPDRGVRGVFCGGTTMTPQMVRFLIEEVLENRVRFVPTYGNTLMGLARSIPLTSDDHYSVTYWAPQPRAVLRVVKPERPEKSVDYNEFGRIELTTMTKEFFMPRFLERDKAVRRSACAQYTWDGVGDVRPFESTKKAIIEGVY